MSGDRSYVTLHVLKAQAEQAQALFDGEEPDEEQLDAEGPTSFFAFTEMRGGVLPFLSNLKEAGIAYEASWEAGGDYGAGTESCRFTADGEDIVKEIYDEWINPSMASLLELIDDPTALRAFILDHKKVNEVLPWDNQAEYGQRYLARQLIGA